jgi:hypothetical protein
LRLALGNKLGHDRGGEGPLFKPWVLTYLAEARQREAEALFKLKGISRPESGAK